MAGFQIQCTTTSPGESVTLPFVTGYTYDCYIDWDDATPPSHITAWDDPNATHTYAMAGSYTITITGACPAWSVNNTHSSRLQWTGIVYWGDAVDFDGWQYLYGGWYGCSNLASLGSGYILSDGLADIFRAFQGTSISAVQSNLFADCSGLTSAFAAFALCPSLLDIPDGLCVPLVNCVNFSYTFYNDTDANIHPWVFYADGDQDTRFLNQNVNFYRCFRTTSTSGYGTAPDLWACAYGTGTPNSGQCFDGHSASTLDNYNFIPISWGGTAFSPSAKLLAGAYAYDGLDVGQLRDFTSRLLTGAYAYDGLDVGIITPTRKMEPGNYTYSGLALGVSSPYHPMTSILAWIQEIVGPGISVIFADQNAPAPTGIYLSVRFVTQTSTPDKIANSRRTGSVIRYHMESSSILGVDVKAFSAAGSSLLGQIELGTRDPHSKSVPALIDCGPIYGPTFFNDTHYRPMYHREFRFRIPAVLDTVGSRVRTLGLGGDVDDLEPSVEETFE